MNSSLDQQMQVEHCQTTESAYTCSETGFLQLVKFPIKITPSYLVVRWTTAAKPVIKKGCPTRNQNDALGTARLFRIAYATFAACGPFEP